MRPAHIKTTAASGFMMSEETKWLAAARVRPSIQSTHAANVARLRVACEARGQERHSHVRKSTPQLC